MLNPIRMKSLPWIFTFFGCLPIAWSQKRSLLNNSSNLDPASTRRVISSKNYCSLFSPSPKKHLHDETHNNQETVILFNQKSFRISRANPSVQQSLERFVHFSKDLELSDFPQKSDYNVIAENYLNYLLKRGKKSDMEMEKKYPSSFKLAERVHLFLAKEVFSLKNSSYNNFLVESTSDKILNPFGSATGLYEDIFSRLHKLPEHLENQVDEINLINKLLDLLSNPPSNLIFQAPFFKKLRLLTFSTLHFFYQRSESADINERKLLITLFDKLGISSFENRGPLNIGGSADLNHLLFILEAANTNHTKLSFILKKIGLLDQHDHITKPSEQEPFYTSFNRIGYFYRAKYQDPYSFLTKVSSNDQPIALEILKGNPVYLILADIGWARVAYNHSILEKESNSILEKESNNEPGLLKKLFDSYEKDLNSLATNSNQKRTWHKNILALNTKAILKRLIESLDDYKWISHINSIEYIDYSALNRPISLTEPLKTNSLFKEESKLSIQLSNDLTHSLLRLNDEQLNQKISLIFSKYPEFLSEVVYEISRIYALTDDLLNLKKGSEVKIDIQILQQLDDTIDFIYMNLDTFLLKMKPDEQFSTSKILREYADQLAETIQNRPDYFTIEDKKKVFGPNFLTTRLIMNGFFLYKNEVK